jgi:hypothetical protein
MTTNDELKPCPFCGASLKLIGDYTSDAAWNIWCHPECDEDSDCLLASHTISTGRDMRTPHPREKALWNRRAPLPGENT